MESNLRGSFEVRDSQGRVRRLQEVTLPLPAPLARALSEGWWPTAPLSIERGPVRTTLWPRSELIELQVGYRWHGFSGQPMREWDPHVVVFGEVDGDPVALRLDETDGPVWHARRGEGRYRFVSVAPTLAAYFQQLNP